MGCLTTFAHTVLSTEPTHHQAFGRTTAGLITPVLAVLITDRYGYAFVDLDRVVTADLESMVLVPVQSRGELATSAAQSVAFGSDLEAIDSNAVEGTFFVQVCAAVPVARSSTLTPVYRAVLHRQ